MTDQQNKIYIQRVHNDHLYSESKQTKSRKFKQRSSRKPKRKDNDKFKPRKQRCWKQLNTPYVTLFYYHHGHSTYEILLSMGFGTNESEAVARMYGSDADAAIHHLIDIHDDQPDTFPVTLELQPRLAQWREPLLEFKESEIARILVSGFFRSSCDYAFADVLQSMIIKYTNMHFVRLIGLHGHSRSVIAIASHSNRSLRSIAHSFEANDKVHFWVRFSALREIYPIDTKSDQRRRSNHHKYEDFKVTAEDIALESDDRWVEVPDDLYHELTLHALNALGVHEILIKRWPILDLDLAGIRAVDPDAFDALDDYSLDAALKGTAVCKELDFDFSSLRVGDIIDARDCEGKWYEAVVRFACPSFLCVHFIGWHSRWDEKLCLPATDYERMAKRGTHTNGAHIKDSVRCYPALKLPVTEAVVEFFYCK